MNTDPPPRPFVRVLFERAVELPDGTLHGTAAAYSVDAAPLDGDLLHALTAMVLRFDQSTAEGIAEQHGDAEGMAFLDAVAAVRTRWEEETR